MVSSTRPSSQSNDLSKAVAFFSGAEMPARVWSRKYRLRDKVDNFLEDSPLQTFCRMADAVGAPTDSTMRQNLVERRFIPAGRILFALGNPYFSATLKNCLTGDSWVRLADGWAQLQHIAMHSTSEAPVKVVIDGEEKNAHAWSNGVKKVVQITTKEGYTVKATPDHRFRLEDGSWREAGSLEPGELLDLGHDDGSLREGRTADGPANDRHYVYGYAAGLFVGDGTFAGDGFKVANVRLFGQKAHVPINLISGIFGGQPIIHEDHVSYNSTGWASYMEDRLGIRHGEKGVTDQVMSHTSVFQAGFLRGLFDADAHVNFSRKPNSKGVVCTTREIRLGQSNLETIRRVQTMLLGFGIKSKVYKNGEAGPRDFGDRGIYDCKAAWVLNITRSSFKRFVEKIGFSHPDKAATASSAVAYGKFKRENWFARVESVEDVGEAEVFDMSVDDIHAFNANGLIAHNCYVLGLRDDSLEAISDLRREMARTYAMGGGVGIDLSSLRPAGAPVKNCAITSSGAASFADGFSHLTGEIGQNGRRGALMISLSVDHPDVERFIHAKNDFDHSLAQKIREKLPRTLYKQLNEEVIEPRRSCGNANMSVRLTDRFMQAVKDGKHHITRFIMDDGKEITEVFDAKKLFRQIVEGAWSHGCPGCLFWDTMAREDNRNYLDPRWHIVTTNPCVTGDTRLATQHGLVKIEDLQISGSDLLCTVDTRALDAGKGATTRSAVPAFVTSESADVWEVTTRDGYSIKATAWHDFYTQRGKIKLHELQVGDKLWVQSGKGQFGQEGSYDLGFLMGLIAGDGHFTNRGKNKQAAVVSLWGEDRRFVPKVVNIVNEMVVGKIHNARKVGSVCVEERDEERVRSVKLAEILAGYGFTKETKLQIPEIVWRGTEDCVKGYLHGLFQADGTVNVSGHKHAPSCSVRLPSSSPEFLKEVQILLANYGVYGPIRKRRDAGMRSLPDGKGGKKEYDCKADYELIIDGESRDQFMREIGFADQEQRNQKYCHWAADKVLRKTQSFETEIESIVHIGKRRVFDTTQEDHNTVIFNGLVTGQCGEQPLSDGGSCNLGAVNLARFTAHPYTDRAEFDWNGFKQAVRDGVRFLDEINTIELEENRAPISKQAEVTHGLRQIGLGVMGYGDLLLQHQIKYGSDDALQFTDKLFRVLRDTAYYESAMLAKEKGPFPAFDWEKIKRSPFIDRLPAELKKLIAQHGLRNSNVLSIAPTGTIAIMGETTGGIEPEFAFQLTRAAQLGTGKRTKFTFLTPTAQRIAKALGKSVPQGEIEGAVDMSWLPEWAVASHQIDPKRRAMVQGLIQKYIDTAISSTVNLPETATVEDVMEIYWTAYEAGCKGVTIYREGSREGILQTLQEEERLEYPIEPPLQVASKRISFKGEHGLQRILINLGDYRPGVPCEVSVIHGKSGTEVASYASALGIVISIALQNGVHPIKIARALEGINAGWAARLPLDGKGNKPTTVQSVPDAVAAAMRKFYGEGIYEKGVLGQPINGETNKIGWELTAEERQIARICPKCQKQTYIPDSGCWRCINPACDVDGICG